MDSDTDRPATYSGTRSGNTKPKGVIAVVVGIVALAVAVGIGYLILKPDTFELHGTVTIKQGVSVTNWLTTPGSGCQGTEAFSDLATGAPLSVTDATGTVVATGTIEGNGVPLTINSDTGTEVCIFSWSVKDVPVSKDDLTVSAGNQGRVTVTPLEAHDGVRITAG